MSGLGQGDAFFAGNIEGYEAEFWKEETEKTAGIQGRTPDD